MHPEVLKFITQYKSEFPLSYWEKQTKRAVKLAKQSQKRTLTTDEKIELYSQYIQLLEITIVVMRCFTDDIQQFMHILFKSDQLLASTLLDLLQNDDLRINIVTATFNIRSQKSITRHAATLKSVIEDYVADRGLLNSYKHGFRVKGGPPFTNIEIETAPGKWKSIGRLDNVVAYSEREIKNGKVTILEREIGFIPELLVYKLRFTYQLLTNLIRNDKGPFLAKAPKATGLTFIRGRQDTISFTLTKTEQTQQ